MKLTHIVLACSILGLTACSSIKSSQSMADSNNIGLSYFLPKRDILVTISIDKDGKISDVAIASGDAYPDPAKRYLLQHGSNMFGKNTLDIGISEAGLLTSAKSTTESHVSEALKNLASSLGTVKTTFSATKKEGKDKVCTTPGSHVFLVDLQSNEQSFDLCGLTIGITKLEKDPASQGQSGTKASMGVDPHIYEGGSVHSGVFYRQNIPYRITASGFGMHKAAIVLSPSGSPTYFLPASHTFFSNNKADFGFNNGVPNKYMQETEGELTALLKLPADIISAYFAAIGSVFDAFKNNDSKEAAALKEAYKLELLKKQLADCNAAIKAKDDAKYKELGCDKL